MDGVGELPPQSLVHGLRRAALRCLRPPAGDSSGRWAGRVATPDPTRRARRQPVRARYRGPDAAAGRHDCADARGRGRVAAAPLRSRVSAGSKEETPGHPLLPRRASAAAWRRGGHGRAQTYAARPTGRQRNMKTDWYVVRCLQVHEPAATTAPSAKRSEQKQDQTGGHDDHAPNEGDGHDLVLRVIAVSRRQQLLQSNVHLRSTAKQRHKGKECRHETANQQKIASTVQAPRQNKCVWACRT